jgi:hypothetical protein
MFLLLVASKYEWSSCLMIWYVTAYKIDCPATLFEYQKGFVWPVLAAMDNNADK